MAQPVNVVGSEPITNNKPSPIAAIIASESRPSSSSSAKLAQKTIMQELAKTPTRTSMDHDLSTPGTCHPYSPFYQHPETPSFMQQIPSRTSFEKDVEKGHLSPPAPVLLTSSTRSSFEPSFRTETTHANKSGSSFFTPIKHVSTTRTSCGRDGISLSVWPTCSEMQQRKKEARRAKSCFLFRSLSRKQKIVVKILIAILIVGIAVALGCIISYKTGGLVWKSANSYGTIGS